MKKLKGIKSIDAINAFIKAGGIKKSGKGDHVNIKMNNGMIITIPSKGDVKLGLLKAAIKKANMTELEFLNFLGD